MMLSTLLLVGALSAPSALDIQSVSWSVDACPRGCHHRQTEIYADLTRETVRVSPDIRTEDRDHIRRAQWDRLSHALGAANIASLPEDISIDSPQHCPGLVMTERTFTIQVETPDDTYGIFYVQNCHYAPLDILIGAVGDILPGINTLPGLDETPQ
ncbi:hypothetical protein [Woodsholea maritima]|uniref:hypothetical protein n=1 Tax=Woodsholea maritima TaxID=240237 RepID=UPI00036689AA|nr:hypothetical protein [Woodsholea maritima]